MTEAPHILVLAPTLHGSLRGNAVHAERKAKLLADAGFRITMIDGSLPLTPEIFAKAQDADALLALHAWRTKAHADTILAKFPKLPLLIATTGTDVPPGLDDDKTSEALESFVRAARIFVQHQGQARELAMAFPSAKLEAKCRHIPPSVSMPWGPLPARELSRDGLEILHVSGLRPIKGVGFAPEFMRALWKEEPNARYTLVGDAIDDAYAAPVLDWIAHEPRAEHLSGLSHHATLALMERSDVMLSTARHEGLSNALLEAMACGLPVVATRIVPNLEIIEDGVTGLLYDGTGGFVAALRRLLREPTLYQAIRQHAQAYLREHHTAAQEQSALLEAFAEIGLSPT